MRSTSIGLALCLAMFTSVASAEERTWDFGAGVGPNFSQLDAVGDELSSGLGFAVWADRYFTEHWYGELSYGYFDFGSSGTTHLDAFLLGVGYRFDDWGKFSPYVVGGAGVGNAKDFPRSTPQQTGFMLHLRPGIDYPLNERWNIGFAFDWSMINLDGNRAKAAYMGLPMLNLTWKLGSSKEEPAPAPPPAPAPAPTPEPDVDSDGDGVVDRRDRCPDTPAGKAVNGFGCIKGEKIEMKLMVNFATGSDVVPPESDGDLRELADLLSRNPKATVQIEGHTDSVGSKRMNMDLSKKRAAAVARYIIRNLGVDKSRISAIGYGPTRPIATNDTPEGRAQNRRVLGTFKAND